MGDEIYAFILDPSLIYEAHRYDFTFESFRRKKNTPLKPL